MMARTLLVISPWEQPWSLGSKAGVSDEAHFVEGFTRAGYYIHMLLPESDTPRPKPLDARIRIHDFPNVFAGMENFPTPVKRLSWMPLFQAMAIPRALRLAREVRPDAVLGLSYYATAAAWACGRRLGVPAVGKLFGVMDLVHTEWPALKYRFKNAEQIAGMKVPMDAWIILDDGTRGDEAARRLGIPTERIHFLPNGVDLSWADREVDRGPARRRFGLPEDGAVALFLARLVASKRPDAFVRAAAIAPAGTTFVFAGDGPERAACEALARDLGVDDRVRFAGVVPHDDVPALMAASDVFVSTSNLTNKALPTCEAMLCGVPVVAWDVGDTGALVRDGETGALVPDGDIGALARALGTILSDDEGRRRMGAAARRVALESLTGWEERVAMELDIFDRLIADNEKGGGA